MGQAQTRLPLRGPSASLALGKRAGTSGQRFTQMEKDVSRKGAPVRSSGATLYQYAALSFGIEQGRPRLNGSANAEFNGARRGKLRCY